MDIDFHYYATYVAARFAGYTGAESLTIANSAQMIDENGRHALVSDSVSMTTGLKGIPDDFELRDSPMGPALHTYRVQMTFQGVGDCADSYAESLSCIWPVFHFLPGNFVPSIAHITASSALEGSPAPFTGGLARGGPGTAFSTRWSRRELTDVRFLSSTSEVQKKFRWICRPHSPMAIGLINNCTDLVHDTQSEVHKHHMEMHMVGVTMHVFIDTWAHQDFAGMASAGINKREGDPSIAYLSGPDMIAFGKSASALYNRRYDFTKSKWQNTAPSLSPAENHNGYLGHGQVGHWPDHSSLVWKYKPIWSSAELTRENPLQFFDAFVHMVWGMHCIKNNYQYMPFDLTDANLNLFCGLVGITRAQLVSVYQLIATQRDPWGTAVSDLFPVSWVLDDRWDASVFEWGQIWQDAIANTLGLAADPNVPSDWIPGKSQWVLEALSGHQLNQMLASKGEARKGSWFSVAQFQSLDFFKFNLAAKFHFRFVQQQLLVFNEPLHGDWADGAAYADDLARVTLSAHQRWLMPLIDALSGLQRTEAVGEVRDGLTVLIEEVRTSVSPADAHAKLLGALASADRSIAKEQEGRPYFWAWCYGLVNENGKMQSTKAYAKIREIADSIGAGEVAFVQAPAVAGALTSKLLPSFDEWWSLSRLWLSVRGNDRPLVAIDDAYRGLYAHFMKADASPPPAGSTPAAVMAACDVWLGGLARGKGDKERRPAVMWLKNAVERYAP